MRAVWLRRWAELPVALEHRAGYEREKFELWVDADADGCDTRKEVLLAEATRVRDVVLAHASLVGQYRRPS